MNKEICVCIYFLLMIFARYTFAVETISGFVDYDAQEDTLCYSIKYDENSKAKIKILFTECEKEVCEHAFIYEPDQSNVVIDNIEQGIIRIITGEFAGTADEYHYFYRYNPKKEHWYLSKSFMKQKQMAPYGMLFPTAEFMFFDGTECIDGSTIDFGSSTLASVEIRKGKLRNDFDSLYATTYKKYKVKKLDTMEPKDHTLLNIAEMIEAYPVSSENIQKYNDLAYFFSKKEESLVTAGYMLEEVIKADSGRTVAYLNLGDAYWEIENEVSAVKSYKVYRKQMESDGKTQIIPDRVYARIKKVNN